nr:extracellular solute-binding protein [Beijerinckia indica]
MPPAFFFAKRAKAQEQKPTEKPVEGEAYEAHGLSIFGDLALPPDFKHLPYVNPDAPKGGIFIEQAGFNTFNTLNVFILKGDGAAGMGLIFDSLMTGSNDEPDALYGLVAHKVEVSADRTLYRFFLRKEARFHDGSKIKASDVVFSLNLIKTKGHPVLRQGLRDLESAEAEAEDIVRVRMRPGHSRESPLTVASQPIFSQAYYTTHNFEETTLEPPLGSAAYKVGPFEQGRYISFTRVENYWGKDLPINRGRSNFDVVRYEYFNDRKVAFEAFKAGVFTYREEYTSLIWATGYDFAALKEGKVKRETVPDAYPRGTQGWFLNTRRTKFKDARIRRALGYAFDFEWTDANIMYNLYKRTVSYFQNSPMAAEGLPSAEERALLTPFEDQLPPEVFGEAVVPPVSDGSGQDRKLLREASEQLRQAGCTRKGNTLLLPDGKPFEIEFLGFETSFQPHTAAFIKNLKLLGIDADYRVVDAAQYKRRVDEFDYDIVTERFSFGLTPGEDMRLIFGSETANLSGSRNVAGIALPSVDALIAKALVVDTRENLTTICRAIDRILRAHYFWVPMWNNPNHLLAFWDLFGRPERMPHYDVGVPSTWWFDPQKAQRIGWRKP